jgi:alkylhydroperoxidase family enzyme
MDATLIGLLRPKAIPLETLRHRYGSLLELVRKLIGVIPNCDSYLEIWPPAFRTYNLMVPNFLNLPLSLWGLGAPKDIVGLAMYVSSRSAQCAYCSAHTCSFALRRGTAPEKVARALDAAYPSHTPAERAVIAVARSLSRVPCELTEAERDELGRHFSPANLEWIVLGISMMGFLNKFMDAVGVELEGSTVDEVESLIAPSGWAPGKHLESARPRADIPAPRADTLRTKLGVIAHVPSALSLDVQWTAGAPKRWPAVASYLRERTGHDFPVLSRLRHARAIRAIAVMLRDNLDETTTVLGLPVKCLAGITYANAVADLALADELEKLGAQHPISREARGEAAQAALLLAEAASATPAVIPQAVVDACASSNLPAAAIVELIAWLSLLQLLHRLSSFYRT